MRNYFIILLSILFFSCSDKNDQPERLPLNVREKVINDFNYFKSDFNGFFYIDMKAVSCIKSYSDFRSDLEKLISTKLIIPGSDFNKLAKSVNIDFISSIESYCGVFYLDKVKSDYSLIIRSNSAIRNFDKKLNESGWNVKSISFMLNEFNQAVNKKVWLFNKNNKTYIRAIDEKTFLIVSNLKEYLPDSVSSVKVKSILNSQFNVLSSGVNQSAFYIGIPEGVKFDIENKDLFGDYGDAVGFQLDLSRKTVIGTIFISDFFEMKTVTQYPSNNHLFSFSFLSKLTIGYNSLKSILNNKTSFLNFIDITHIDSTLYVDFKVGKSDLSEILRN